MQQQPQQQQYCTLYTHILFFYIQNRYKYSHAAMHYTRERTLKLMSMDILGGTFNSATSTAAVSRIVFYQQTHTPHTNDVCDVFNIAD